MGEQMAAKRQKKKTIKSQSLTEFRAWLTGVEEMQEDGWVPNETQWQLIRERIDKISIDDEVEQKLNQTAPSPSARPTSQPANTGSGNAPVEIPQVPSAFDRAGAAGNFVPADGGQPKIQHATDPKKTVTTPEIDTSQGDYKSGFL